MNSKFVVAQIQCFTLRKALQSDVVSPKTSQDSLFDAMPNTHIHIDYMNMYCSNANDIIKAWI